MLSNTQEIPTARRFAALLLACLMLVLVLVAMPATAQAAANPVLASADTYTVSTLPTATNGTNTKVAVGTNSGTRVGYLEFPTSNLASASQTELQLSIEGGTAGTLQVHTVSGGWKESTANHANAPKTGSLIGTVKVAGGQQVVKVVIPLPTSNSSTVSIALQRTDGGITRINSRETGSSTAPRMTAVQASTPAEPTPPTTGSCTVSAKLVPSCGALFGAAGNPLAGESWDQAFLNFEKTAGRPMDIVHYYKSGQSSMFPSSNEINRQNQAGANRILFYNWKPRNLTWRQVADGAADSYLTKLAQHMKANAAKPFFLSLNAEMEDEVNTNAQSGQTAKDFAAFYRHVVEVLRSNGVTNAVMVMNYTGIQKWGEMTWFEDLYPGNDVVDWIAQDPYNFGKPPVWLTDLSGMVNRTNNTKTWPGFYNWASSKYPSKPQMLGEFGIDEDPAYPNHKADFWRTAEAQLRTLPSLKALVYWDSNDFDPVGLTRVDSSQASLTAFRAFVASDYVTSPGKNYLR